MKLSFPAEKPNDPPFLVGPRPNANSISQPILIQDSIGQELQPTPEKPNPLFPNQNSTSQQEPTIKPELKPKKTTNPQDQLHDNNEISSINLSRISGESYLGMSAGLEGIEDGSFSPSRSQASRNYPFTKNPEEDPFLRTKEILQRTNFNTELAEPTKPFLDFLAHFEGFEALSLSEEASARLFETYLVLNALYSEFQRLNLSPIVEQMEILKTHVYDYQIETDLFPIFEETPGESFDDKFLKFVERIYQKESGISEEGLIEFEHKLELANKAILDMHEWITKNEEEILMLEENAKFQRKKEEQLQLAHAFRLWTWKSHLQKKLDQNKRHETMKKRQEELEKVQRAVGCAHMAFCSEGADYSVLMRKLKQLEAKSSDLEQQKRLKSEKALNILKSDNTINQMRKEIAEKHREISEAKKSLSIFERDFDSQKEKFEKERSRVFAIEKENQKKEQEKKKNSVIMEYWEEVQKEIDRIERELIIIRGEKRKLQKESDRLEMDITGLSKEIQENSWEKERMEENRRFGEEELKAMRTRRDFYKGIGTFLVFFAIFAVYETSKKLQTF